MVSMVHSAYSDDVAAVEAIDVWPSGHKSIVSSATSLASHGIHETLATNGDHRAVATCQ